MADQLLQDLTVSFRKYLRNEISEFTNSFKKSLFSADHLTETLVVLANYQEEGFHLFPAVFIAENIHEILNVTKGLDSIIIGRGPLSLDHIRLAFKKCAPLAEDRTWAIYLVIENSVLTYGIFRSDQSPLSPTSFERLRLSKNPSINIIGLSRLGGSFVEIRNGHGHYRYVNVSGDQDESGHPKDVIRKFMKIVTKDCPIEIKTQLQSFYYRVGFDILHSNHGSLVAVVNQGFHLPALFDDGVMLEPSINIIEGVSRFLRSNKNEDYQQLVSWNILLRKMTSMDGITIIDSTGAIIGYNYFIKNSALGSPSELLGGARRRAFEVLRSHLSENLLGVVYKSRDGGVEIESSHELEKLFN